MRTTIRCIATVGALTALASTPAAAGASHHGKRHGHRVHAHHARLRVFGIDQPTSNPSPSPSAQSAGTVASFDNGVLTIKLADGSAVAGQVTGATEIECPSSGSAQTAAPSGSARTRESDGEAEGSDRPAAGQTREADDNERSGSGDQEDSDREDSDESTSTSCTTSALTPGATVQEAELRLGSGGAAVWKHVDLG